MYFDSPDDTYKIGDKIYVRASTAESIQFFAVPHDATHTKVALETGEIDRFAYYNRHWDENIVYVYTVQEGDHSDDLDYNATNALYWRTNSGTNIIDDDGADEVNCVLSIPGQSNQQNNPSLSVNADVVVDGIRPRVLNVTPGVPGGTYGAGSSINITVNFGEPVRYSGAAPLLRLDHGGTADYASGNGTGALNFTYLVRGGDSSPQLDYAGPRALSAGGPMTDIAGNRANLTLPGPGSNGSLVAPGGIAIDTSGTSAYAANVSSPDANGTYRAGVTVNITVAFNREVVVEGEPHLLLATSPPGHAVYSGGNGTAELAFQYKVRQGDMPGRLDYANASALVLAGGASITNPSDNTTAVLSLPVPGLAGSLGHTKNIAIDGVAPRLLEVSSSNANGTYGTGRILGIEIVFSEPVVVAEGAPAALGLATTPPRDVAYAGVNGSSLVFLYTVRPGDSAADLGYTAAAVQSLAATMIWDLAGNPAAGSLSLPAPKSPGSLAASKDIAIHGAPSPVLAPAGWAMDDSNFTRLGGAIDAAAIPYNGSSSSGDTGGALVAVASAADDGVQMVRVHENGTLEAGTVLFENNDNNDGLELNEPHGIDAFRLLNGSAYVIVASIADDGVQLVRVHEDGTLVAKSRLLHGAGLNLDGVIGIDAFRLLDNSTYAIVASTFPADSDSRGVQLVRVHEDGTLAAADALDDDGDLLLHGGSGVSAFRMANGSTLVAVGAYDTEIGVQLVRVHEDGTLAAADSIGDNGTLLLGGVRGIDTIRTPGGSTFAVTASPGDNGVQLVRIHDNGTLEAEGSLGNGPGLELNQAWDVDAFSMHGYAYALAVADADSGAQLMRIYDDGTMRAAGAARDGAGGFEELGEPEGVKVFETAGGRMFGIVAARGDSGVQLVRLSPPHVTSVSAGAPGGTYLAGQPIDIRVNFSEPVAVSGPPPSLLLAPGDGTARAAEYLSGSGTNSLAFRYAAQPGDGSGLLAYAGPAALTTRGIVEDLRAANASTGATAADLELPSYGEPASLGASDIMIDAHTLSVQRILFQNESGAYGAGSAIRIAVEFDGDVLVAGIPRLALTTSPPANATYSTGNGTNTLEFVYVVRPGDSADPLGYAGRTALSADAGGSAIHRSTGRNASLLLPDPGVQDGPPGPRIVVDTKPPRMAGASAVSLDRVRVEFDEPVVSAGNAAAGWSISGPDAAGLAVESGSDISSPSTVLTLALGGELSSAAPSIALSYDSRSGGIADRAGNALMPAANRAVDDRIPPTVASSLIVADGRIEIVYTEPAYALSGAYRDLVLAGANRTIDDVMGNGSATHTLEFAPPAELGAGGSVTIDRAAVRDRAGEPNRLGPAGDLVQPIGDSRILQVASSRVTGPDTAVVVYTRPAPAQPEDYESLVVDGLPRRIAGLDGGEGGGARTHTLTFSPGGAPPNATGSVAVGVDNLYGGARTLNLTDGQRPVLLDAVAVSGDMVRAVLSEPVVLGGAGASGWSISGGDAEGLNVSAASLAAQMQAPSAAALSLALDGNLSGGTAPSGMTLRYDPGQGGVADPAGNRLDILGAAVGDGIAPEIASAAITSPNKAMVTYSEAVHAPPDAYRSVTLSTGGGPRPVAGLDGNETETHTISFGGGPAVQGTVGTLWMDTTAVRDMAENRLGDDDDFTLRLGDGQAPALPPAPPGQAAVRSAVFTARNAATITYSDALDKPEDHPGYAYGSVVIAGEDAARTVTAEEGLGTAVHTVRFDGDGIGADQNGTVALAVTLEGAASSGGGGGGGDSGQTLRFAAPAQIPVAPGRILHTVILSQEQPDRTVEIRPDGFTRAVDATAAGPGARPAVNVSALADEAEPGSGVLNIARFPAEPVTLSTESAAVAFPPNAAARPIPPEGVLFLRGLPGERYQSLAAAVASALGHPNASGLGLGRVVEAGGGAPVAFDRPVRVFLADQSGGRAFYVNGSAANADAAAAIAPIDDECGSDDADAVHEQLGGAGECQLDMRGGADGARSGKAIYTYHLSLFGTVRTADAGPVDPVEPVELADAPEIQDRAHVRAPQVPVDPADAPRPSLVSVLQRAGGDPLRAPASYSAGQSIVLEVRFTAPVAVAAGGGSGGAGAPFLELRTGSAGARAAYSSGSGTDSLEFEYAVRGGDIAARLSYAGTGSLALNGSAITAVGSGAAASVALPEPGSPGSLSHAGSPAVRIDPEPGRPVLDIGILDDEAGAAPAGVISAAAAAAAYGFNEQQGRAAGALIVNATVYDAGTTAESAAEALQAAHAGGAGPSVYVGPSTDRGLHAAMPYASENGIVLVSAGSTAPSLAVGGDQTFRLLPSDRLEAEALARLALGEGAESMHAVLENATYGPPAAAGSLEDANLPPPQGRFLHGFDEALSYAGVPSLSGTVSMGGAAGSYAAAAAAEALDASVRSGGPSGGGSPAAAAVVYLGSPEGLAALAEASAGYPALASAPWFASGLSAGSALLAGDGPAAAFAARVGLEAARQSLPGDGPAREIDPLLPPGADAGTRHRAYAAYDAVFLLGTAASASGARDGAVDPAAVADLLPGTAAAYAGALGDIALDYAGDAWVPAKYDRWAVARGGSGSAAAAAEWTRQPGALDGERACSISLARAKIDYGPIDSGQTSRPHLQSIVNTGQLPFLRVDLTATPWHVDSPGACAPGDQPSLPAGLSEIRTELGGRFLDLAGSGTVLARGLEPGGLSPLWYRLSLEGYADLPQAQITQCATYVVRCG